MNLERIWITLFCSILTTGLCRAEEKVDFAKQIAPIFEQHCIRCHVPGNEKGDFSIATFKDLKESDYVDIEDPKSSYLLELISSHDGKKPAMPKEGEALTDDQIQLIERWIQSGAEWPEKIKIVEKSKADKSWWSLQPLKADVSKSLDDFITDKLQQQGLQRNPPPDRRTLIRRATYDLIGLPPTPKEIEAFVNDSNPQAYENLLDRLLASPRYGEHWGRHWLDVVRFGESNGFERNVIINNIWPFRDYVIRSINDDKPFDQLIREHIAGDVFGKDQPEKEVATAFLVAGPYDDVGNQDPVQAAQIRANTIDEMIRATGEAFLGLTIGCARCHNHKFDPILQSDYYAFYSTFSGVRHGSREVATKKRREDRTAQLKPLEEKRNKITKQKIEFEKVVNARAAQKATMIEKSWVREKVNRQGTEETFSNIKAKFVRLISEGQDRSINNKKQFSIDEFEIWTAEEKPQNIALASNGSKASGPAREIKDFPGAYGPHLAIDGKAGARFLATDGHLTIELAEVTPINRVWFSSARGEEKPEHRKFLFVGEYRIETSLDGSHWTEVSNSYDRKPVSEEHQKLRLYHLTVTKEDREKLSDFNKEIQIVSQEIAKVPKLENLFIGSRSDATAKGPHHIFIGGSPQRKGEMVVPASLSAMNEILEPYQLSANSKEEQRRQALANWIASSDNPLTLRVLANRLWHYHFNTGIVDTPSDFGYMGGKPSHPELLDWLAEQLRKNHWKIKPMHKLIMMSKTYQQSSEYHENAGKIDGDSRLLWRFPPRRLSAEEIRDTILSVSNKIDLKMGGPGFRLYKFMQDNVCTYIPLDQHGTETYRRAVYHQNARASVVDLMTDFDQPDCAFSTPKRSETTTPLQALTMLNHQFTLDMATALAERAKQVSEEEPVKQIQQVYLLCYGRKPNQEELNNCVQFVNQHSLTALCRVILNTSEMIYVK